MAALIGLINAPLGNELPPIPYLLLTTVIVAAAFSRRELAESLLHRNDISYGLYIWHMPVINVFLYLGWSGKGWMVVVAVALSVLAAIASWVFVERPALRLKRRALVRV